MSVNGECSFVRVAGQHPNEHSQYFMKKSLAGDSLPLLSIQAGALLLSYHSSVINTRLASSFIHFLHICFASSFIHILPSVFSRQLV